jgi:hypothetical protein
LACGGEAADAPPTGDGLSAQTPAMAPESEFTALFDGTSLDQWRGYRSEEVPGAWSIEGDLLAFDPAFEGGDLITREQFSDFELRLDWKVSEGGNSGVFFHVTEQYDWPWMTGPEMQVLDNDGHADGQSPLTSAGSNYALHGPVRDVTHPAGEWNEARLIVRGIEVEHWLNGERVVQYRLWTPEWLDAVQGSKFADMQDYGLARTGHIGLQDHGNPVWFRNIRIREIGDGG